MYIGSYKVKIKVLRQNRFYYFVKVIPVFSLWRFIFLIKTLNVFDLYIKIEKSLNKPSWLKKRLKTATFDCQFFAAIDTFNCESRRTQISSRPNIEVAFIFIIISNAALTTQKFVNKVGKRFFGNAVFKSK